MDRVFFFEHRCHTKPPLPVCEYCSLQSKFLTTLQQCLIRRAMIAVSQTSSKPRIIMDIQLPILECKSRGSKWTQRKSPVKTCPRCKPDSGTKGDSGASRHASLKSARGSSDFHRLERITMMADMTQHGNACSLRSRSLGSKMDGGMRD